MGLIRLDFLTSYLSDPIVSGYTSGAAVHIFSAQLDVFFGLRLDKAKGVGKIILVIKVAVSFEKPDTYLTEVFIDLRSII